MTATLQAEEISAIIKSRLEQFEVQTTVNNVGTVMAVGDGIARIYGLRNAMSGEMVEFEDGKQTIEQLVKSKGATINAFTMFTVGEGIEKKVVDYAAEVAAAAQL